MLGSAFLLQASGAKAFSVLKATLSADQVHAAFVDAQEPQTEADRAALGMAGAESSSAGGKAAG